MLFKLKATCGAVAKRNCLVVAWCSPTHLRLTTVRQFVNKDIFVQNDYWRRKPTKAIVWSIISI